MFGSSEIVGKLRSRPDNVFVARNVMNSLLGFKKKKIFMCMAVIG